MKERLLPAGLLLLSILFFSGIHTGVIGLSGYKTNQNFEIPRLSAPMDLVIHPAVASTGGEVSVADIAETSIQSVVNISTTTVTRIQRQQHPFFEEFRRFFGPGFEFEQQPEGERRDPRERRDQGLGSGVIISEDGYIVTNNHVIDNATELKVTLHDEREFQAEVVATDPQTDLAVIKLKGNVKGLRPMPFGDSDALRLGDAVLAIGNPFGLTHTVTMGIVSAKGRRTGGTGRQLASYEDFIQTDAAINPGNSGGALINMRGELVGINTAIVSNRPSPGFMGIGFAIPSNMTQTVITGLITHGRVVRPWLGVMIQDLNPEMAESLGLKDTRGVLISDVVENSPAEKAGLRHRDIVTQVNGKNVTTASQLRNVIGFMDLNQKVNITVIRDGKTRNIQVVLEESRETQVASRPTEKETEQSVLEDVSVANLTQNTREKYNIPESVNNGVVVTGITAGSPVQAAGIREGDVIREINQKIVTDAAMFEKEYKASKESVLLRLFRGGSHIYIHFRK